MNQNLTSTVQKTNKPRIYSLDGLKVIALFMLIWWHGSITNPSFDAGARMCELLFVASGFLVGYNFYGKDAPGDIKGCLKYFFKKVAAVWPLHLLAMVLYFFIRMDYILDGFAKNPADTPYTIISNIFLLQAWSNKIKFSFNGVSWFLSALLFCYFLAPFVAKLIKNKRTTIFLFVLTFALRVFLEFVPYNIFYISIHSSPLIRFLEFFMGMLLVPTFMSCKECLTKFTENKKLETTIIATLIEGICLAGIILLMIYCDKTFDKRAYFIPFYCLLVFVFALEGGLISWLFGTKPFKVTSKLQMELFLFQGVGIYLIVTIRPKIFPSLPKVGWGIFLIEIATILIFALIYHFVISEKATKLMNSFFEKVGNFFTKEKIIETES